MLLLTYRVLHVQLWNSKSEEIKTRHVQKLAICKKAPIFVLHQVSRGSDRKWGFSISGQFLNVSCFFLLRLYVDRQTIKLKYVSRSKIYLPDISLINSLREARSRPPLYASTSFPFLIYCKVGYPRTSFAWQTLWACKIDIKM